MRPSLLPCQPHRTTCVGGVRVVRINIPAKNTGHLASPELKLAY